jgi:hypothetical protein
MEQTYQYFSKLDNRTKGSLELLDASGWTDILLDVLNGKSLPYNIDFSESDVTTRLCELYDIVITYELNVRPYQTALVRLLTEYYGNAKKANEIFSLISTVDYVRPALFYNRLELLATKPEYMPMIFVKNKDRYGYSLHFLLINTLMPLDTDRKLLQFLSGLRETKQLPEYYQVTIRYLYSYCGQGEFDAFMSAVFPFMDEAINRDFAIKAFKEYAYYKNELTLVYGWLFRQKRELFDREPGVFLDFARDLLRFLHEDEETLVKTKDYYALVGFLSVYFTRKTPYPTEVFERILTMPANELSNKNKLIRFLGSRLYQGRPQLLDDGFLVTLPSQTPAFISSEHEAALSEFEAGANAAAREGMKVKGKSSMGLPEKI